MHRQSPTARPHAPVLPGSLVFRCLFVFVSFWGLETVAGLVPAMHPVHEAYLGAWTPLVTWTGGLLGYAGPIHPAATGSGDTLFHWILLWVQVVLSAGVAGAWLSADRRRESEAWARPLLHAAVRHLLACNLLAYGAIKVFSSQFGDPHPELLARTYGESTPQVLLWTFMAYSDGYETFTGLAEMAPGVLLLWRRTTTIGALISIAAMSQVVALNYFYDVPVKILATQLLLASVWLAALDRRRILAFASGRSVPPQELERWPTTPRGRALAVGAKVLFLGTLAVGLAAFFLEDRADDPGARARAQDHRLMRHRVRLVRESGSMWE